MKVFKIGSAVYALAFAAALAGCGSSGAPQQSGTTQASAPREAASSTIRQPTPSSTVQGVGTGHSVYAPEYGQAEIYITQVNDPDPNALSGYGPAAPGTRWVEVVIKIVGISGGYTGTLNTDVFALGTDGRRYQVFDAEDGSGAGGVGVYGVTPGNTFLEGVLYQIPKGVKVAEIQWINPPTENTPVTWNLTPS
jgi:hypothetical protein